MKTMECTTIEDRMQEMRKAKGLSQEQLADVLGVSRQAVSKWESGQSLPEIEKLIAMSDLFGVSIDYILKGKEITADNDGRGHGRLLGAQIVTAVSTMLFLITIFATIGQLGDGISTMDIYAGLAVESVGIMVMLIGWFLAGNRPPSKPLFVANTLLAAYLPASFFTQVAIGYIPGPIPPLAPAPISLFAGIYLAICGSVTYFGLLRNSQKATA